ncbi:hypothetical protein GCM10027034_20070 [Ramlibacter solisilvae]
MGIELKTHTKSKVSLMTAEPDFGIYAESFKTFMKKYGSQKTDGEYRLSGGQHKCNRKNSSTGLTLRIVEYRLKSGAKGKEWILGSDGQRKRFEYTRSGEPIVDIDSIEVILEDTSGQVAAGWSLGRLMNNWGAKHNEAVYIPAERRDNDDEVQWAQGFVYEVKFKPKVSWCRKSSARRLLNAISDGVIFLDPGSKFVEGQPARRRSQWRMGNLKKGLSQLYDKVMDIDLSESSFKLALR